MIKFFVLFILLTVLLFIGYNFFIIPHIGAMLPISSKPYLVPLTPYSSAGLSGIICIAKLLFGKD